MLTALAVLGALMLLLLPVGDKAHRGPALNQGCVSNLRRQWNNDNQPHPETW